MSTYAMPTGALKLHVDKTKVLQNNTYVLVPFNGSGLTSAFWAGLNPTLSGKDFYVSTTDGYILPHDLIYFNPAVSGLHCWIKLNQVSTSADAEFVFNWGSGIYIDDGRDAYKGLYGGSTNATLAMNFESNISGSDSYFTTSVCEQWNEAGWYWTGSDPFNFTPGAELVWREAFSSTVTPTYSTGVFGKSIDLTAVDTQWQKVWMPVQDAYSFILNNAETSFTILSVVAASGRGVGVTYKPNEYAFDYGTPSENTQDGYLVLTLGASTLLRRRTDATIDSSKYIQVAATYNACKNVSGIHIYVNGAEKPSSPYSSSTTYAGMTKTASQLEVFSNRAKIVDGGSSDSHKCGKMDYCIVLNGLMSSGDIGTFYNFLPVDGSTTSIVVDGATTPVAPKVLFPVITTQPQSVTKNIGDFYDFTVVASGTNTYQWQKNNANIVGATLTHYFIPYITADSSGTYRVAVTNVYGTTYSSGAILTVAGTGDGTVSGVGTNSVSKYGGSLYMISGYINHNLVTASDINVPVPIGSSGLPTTFWSHVHRTDGKDIVVTNELGVPYKREIVEFNASNKSLTMWVRFSGLSSAVDTPFIIQYGSTTLNYSNDGVFTNNYSNGLNHVMAAHLNKTGYDSSASRHQWVGYYDVNRTNNWDKWDNALLDTDTFTALSNGNASPLTYYSGGTKFDNGLDLNYDYVSNPIIYGYTPTSTDLSFTDGTNDLPFTMRTWSMLKTGNRFGIDDTTYLTKGRQARYGEYNFGFTGKKFGLRLYTPINNYTLDPHGLGYCWMGRDTTSNPTVTPGTWYNYAATYNGDKTATTGIHLYINGSETSATETRGDQEWSGTVYSGMSAFNADLETGRRVDVIDAQYTPYNYYYNVDVVIDNLFILNGVMTSGALHTQYLLENGYNTSNATFSTEYTYDNNPYTPPDSTDIPVITVPLVNKTAVIGSSVTFSAQVTGPSPLTYFWRHNSIPVVGAAPSYTINPVVAGSAGTYTFGVYNNNGVAYSNATLTVVSSSGLVPDPTGVIPDPNPTGVITIPSGTIEPGISGTITGLGSGYVFIENAYTGFTAEDATNIYQLDLGNIFYEDIKDYTFKFGSLTQGNTRFYMYVSGVNGTLYPNLQLSKDQVNYYNAIEVDLEYNEIKQIHMRYTVESNPTTGYGTLLLGVGEINE